MKIVSRPWYPGENTFSKNQYKRRLVLVYSSPFLWFLALFYSFQKRKVLSTFLKIIVNMLK